MTSGRLREVLSLSPSFQGLLKTGSKLMLIPNNKKLHHELWGRVRAYRGQVINGVLTKV